jgi:hypothetical protein
VRGPSGAGKTTLLRALARLLPDVTGALTLAGRPATDYEPAEWRSRVTLLPQTAAMRPGTVRDNLLMPWRLKVRSADLPPPDGVLEQALHDVGLAEIALGRDASRLSVGQAARVALLRAVLTGPERPAARRARRQPRRRERGAGLGDDRAVRGRRRSRHARAAPARGRHGASHPAPCGRSPHGGGSRERARRRRHRDRLGSSSPSPPGSSWSSASCRLRLSLGTRARPRGGHRPYLPAAHRPRSGAALGVRRGQPLARARNPRDHDGGGRPDDREARARRATGDLRQFAGHHAADRLHRDLRRDGADHPGRPLVPGAVRHTDRRHGARQLDERHRALARTHLRRPRRSFGRSAGADRSGCDSVGGRRRLGASRHPCRSHPHHQRDGRGRDRLHPGHDDRTGARGRRPARRVVLPDRRHAHGGGRHGARLGAGRHAVVPEALHSRWRLHREGVSRGASSDRPVA